MQIMRHACIRGWFLSLGQASVVLSSVRTENTSNNRSQEVILKRWSRSLMPAWCIAYTLSVVPTRMHQNLSLSELLVEFCLKLPGLMDGNRKKEVGISCDRFKTLLKERVPTNSNSTHKWSCLIKTFENIVTVKWAFQNFAYADNNFLSSEENFCPIYRVTQSFNIQIGRLSFIWSSLSRYL